MADESWDLNWDDARGAIELRITGRLGMEEGRKAAARLIELAGSRNFSLVADLSEMQGYDRETRQAWQAAFLRLPGQLKGVSFVGLGPVFRMAAATVCLAARIKAEFYADRAALDDARRPPPTQPPPPASQPVL